MEAAENTVNREQVLQERMKEEKDRVVGELCQLYPSDMKDQLERAYLETVTGDPKKASELLLDILHVRETEDVRFLLAIAYIRGERFDDAKKLLLQINEDQPNIPHVLTHLGHVEFAQGRFKKAAKYFEQVYSIQSYDINYMFEFGVSLMRSGRDQKARNVLERIIDHVERSNVMISEFLMCDVYGFVLEIDARLKNGKFEADAKRFGACLDQMTMTPQAEESMKRIIVTLSMFMRYKWFQPQFYTFITMIQKKDLLKDESAQKCLLSAFSAWESYQYVSDPKVSEITAAFLSSDITRNPKLAQREENAMIDQLGSEWNMSEYARSHPQELDYVKEKYPYSYEENRTLIENIQRDTSSVQARIEKLLLSLSGGNSLFEIHMMMKQDYDALCRKLGIHQ